jgi:hypothetical protein
MPKEKDFISAKEISVFVDHRDDMALELFTYRTLRQTGWWANHGGFYRDTMQDKYRQFDVQGGLDLPKNLSSPMLPKTGIRIAAECKNIDPDVPIVISRMPRTDSESYHCLLKRVMFPAHLQVVQEVRVIRSTAIDAKPYHPGDPVGKSILQYQKNPDAKPPEDPFAKWSQALSSCATLIMRANIQLRTSPDAPDLHFIFPALIVADDALWAVDYDENGMRGEPHQVDEATLFLGQDYAVAADNGSPKYGVSHLHVYTRKGLTNALPTWNNLKRSKEWERVYKFGM